MTPAVSVLCLNAGSSSLKFALYDAGGDEPLLLFRGAMEDIAGAGRCHGWWKHSNGSAANEQTIPGDNMNDALSWVFDCLHKASLPLPTLVGHRVVHGGAEHHHTERLTPALLESLRALVPLAPLHLPGALAGIDAVRRQFPEIPQVACFDTAFHRRMPEIAQRYPLPEAFIDQGIRRYGFHGLSYEYIVSTLGEQIGKRLVIAHLGNGASMVACRDGIPLDTSMGMTPTGGLMMGTRTGDLDPGVLIHLMRQGYDADALEKLLNRQSGLTGVSGRSEDMKTLLTERDSNADAALAVELYLYLARKQLGALAAVLGGLDQLVFTGGIGEHAAPIRAGLCTGLEYLGIHLDSQRNDRHEAVISADDSLCEVQVMATDEDLMIARHAMSFLS